MATVLENKTCVIHWYSRLHVNWCLLVIQVQVQVHPNLEVKIEALQYIEKLIVDLLHTMCNSKPLTTTDVIEQVSSSSFRVACDTSAIWGPKVQRKSWRKPSRLVFTQAQHAQLFLAFAINTITCFIISLFFHLSFYLFNVFFLY